MNAGQPTLEYTAVTGWLGGPSLLERPADLKIALAMDLLKLVEPYAVHEIGTGVSRSFRNTPRGRRLFTDALAKGQIEDVVLSNSMLLPRDIDSGVDGLASVYLIYGFRDSQLSPFQVNLSIIPNTGITFDSVAAQFVAFLDRWFGPLSASSAFVSVLGEASEEMIGDSTGVTGYEARHHAGQPLSWPSLQRYVRGAFWGNGLGPELCERLGGRERVLREAPAAIKRPLGEGVWLQLSDSPPAPAADLARLEHYLSPLLGWTREDLSAIDAPYRVTPPPIAPVEVAEPSPLPSGSEQLTKPPYPRKGVPIRWRGDLEDTAAGLNVYLATSPTPEQRAQLEEVVASWYADGAGGAFGEPGFHLLTGPSSDGTVLRWFVDFGSADERRAVRALARRLAALPGGVVRRLVVGTETVG